MRICFFTENSYKGGMDKLIYTVINNWPDKDDVITPLISEDESIRKKLDYTNQFFCESIKYLTPSIISFTNSETHKYPRSTCGSFKIHG